MVDRLITSVASSVISSALNSLGTLVWNEIISLRDVPREVNFIQAKLNIILGYLKHTENKPNRDHLTDSWLNEIRLLVYEAQDVIENMNYLQRRRDKDSCYTCAFSRYSNISNYLKSLHLIGEKINGINRFIPEIIGITNNISGVNSGESSSIVDQLEDQRDPREAIHISEEDVVGFEIEMRNIVNDLLDPTNEQLCVVSILGMGGIGKSTLARKVFNHPDVKTKFDIRIWITISQQYNVPSLQKKILKVLNPNENEDLEKMSVEEVREKITISLQEKKYLIVIDDIWTIKSWDDINPHNSTFPNTNLGSRIVLTSRNINVGNHPQIRTFIHELQLLDDKRSWELLMKKAFPPYVMLSDLERNKLECLGSQLVKKCKGLPLALVVLGGYLSRHLDHQTWSRMSENVDWNEAGNQINISKILALSYHDLPNDLKPIFLYIAIFPEDDIIKSSDLVKLCIAEGFIPHHQKYKLEILARMYLDQLCERGLIQVVQKNRTHGRISRIRIHDVLRDWGIQRAQIEGFFDVINSSNQAISSVRVAFYGDYDEYVFTSSYLRSFLGFELETKEIYLRNSSSLRVLRYVKKWNYGKSPSKLPKYMKHMLLLRYLSLVECDKVYFPSSIGQLYNLQTLQCIKSKIWSLPSSLWKISTLRHVHLEEIFCKWNGPKKGSGKNIQTLIITAYGKSRNAMDIVVAALEEIQQIVDLRLYPGHHSICGNVLSVLSGHCHLEVLELMQPIMGLTRIPDASEFPPSILKLVLNCSNLVEDPMPVLEKLPKLVLLKLYFSDIPSIHCTVGGFPQLKYLLLHYLNGLEEWKADVGAMPNLHHLKLMVCLNLKMFPEGLMEHNQLKLLEIDMVPHLYELDYSRLANNGCKVVLEKDDFNDSLSCWL